jgi:type II secretory pathway component PulK
LFLQLIPVLSMFFLMTAAASSALWAADLEAQRRQQENHEQQGPRYTDEHIEDNV